MMKKILIIVGVCAGLGVVGSVVTPVLEKHDDAFPDAFNDHVLHERVKTFPTARSAPEEGDGEGMFVLPGWVPEDATDVKVKVQTDGNAKLIRMTLAGKPLRLRAGARCSGGGFGDGPQLDADWWPEDVGDGDGRADCSEMYQLRVVVKGDEVYAWSNGDLAHAQGRSRLRVTGEVSAARGRRPGRLPCGRAALRPLRGAAGVKWPSCAVI